MEGLFIESAASGQNCQNFFFEFSMGFPVLYVIEFEYKFGRRVTDVLKM